MAGIDTNTPILEEIDVNDVLEGVRNSYTPKEIEEIKKELDALFGDDLVIKSEGT